MEYVIGITDGKETLRTKGEKHTFLSGYTELQQSVSGFYTITDTMLITEHYHSAEDADGICYDWYFITNRERTLSPTEETHEGDWGYYTPDTRYLDGVAWDAMNMKLTDFYIRDPFVMLCDGMYFMYGSNIISPDLGDAGFSCYISRDLVNWLGAYDLTAGTVDWSGKDNFWAPEIIYRNGWFYMPVCYRNVETKERGCAMLASQCPLGKFWDISGGWFTDGGKNVIDPSLYISPENEVWCLWSNGNEDTGEIMLAKFNDGITALETEPEVLFTKNDVPWAINGVCEAPFVHTLKNGKLAMLVSGFGEGGYTVGQALADNIHGPWSVMSEPIFSEDGGHAMIFRDKRGKLMMALHQPNTADYDNGIIEHARFIEVKEDLENNCVRLASWVPPTDPERPNEPSIWDEMDAAYEEGVNSI